MMITVKDRTDTFHKDEPTFRHSAWTREIVLSNDLVYRHAVVRATYDFPEDMAKPLLNAWEAEVLSNLNGDAA